MAASSYTWAGKKLTPKELTNSLITDPLPLVVKVVQVPSDYERSCPQMASGKILYIYGLAPEERVALKTTDKTNKYISIPLEAQIKFEVVHTHHRGPPTFLSSLLRGGKVQQDLRVEISGNAGNRLSSTPDQTQSVPYGTLQVFGIYKETILHAQAVTNATGELNPMRRNISVNCPVILDIATGLKGKSSDEFRKFKDRLKQNQSTKAVNQAETLYDIALLSGVPKSLKDVHLLQHTCQLSSTTSSLQTSVAAEADANHTESTVFQAAIARLSDKVGTDIIRTNSTGTRQATQSSDARVSCYYVEAGPRKNRLSYNSEAATPKAVANIYVNAGTLPGRGVGTRAAMEKEMGDAGKGLEGKRTPFGRPKDGVYVNDLKRQEVGKQTKGTVPQPPKVPSPLKVPSQSTTVPLPPALRSTVPSPPAVPLPYEGRSLPAVPLPPELDDDDQGVYEIPVETFRKPRVPSDSTSKVGKKDPLKVSSSSAKTDAGKPTGAKSVFGGLKDKFVKSLPKNSGVGSKWPPAASSRGEDVEGSEEYESLDVYEDAEEYPNRPEVKKEEEKAEGRDDADEDYEVPMDDCKWKSLSQVPKDIKNFTISDVSLCLQLLNLTKYVKPFRERSVDGVLLRKLDKKTLAQMFDMQEFEAKQLVTFAKDNWRPKI